MKYKASKFQILKGDNYFVALDPFTRQWKIFDTPYTDTLYKSLNVIGLELPILEEFEEDSSVKIITVFLSNKCNLRCTYCRFDQWTHHDIEIVEDNVETLISSIESVSLGKRKIGIYFQGGEPLLFQEKIDNICTLLKASLVIDCKIDFYIQTNGTIYSESVLELIEKHNINLGFSFDGRKEEHDIHRPYLSGKGSHEDILKNISNFKQKNIAGGGVFTVITDPQNMIDIYNYYINELKLSSFLFAPLELNGDENNIDVDKYMDFFISGQIAILKKNIEYFKLHGKKIVEELTHNYLRRKIFPELEPHACEVTPYSKCGMTMISIERDGTQFDCQQLREKQHMPDRMIGLMKERFGICENCNIKGHCSGPVCFSRFSEEFNYKYLEGDKHARNMIETICKYNKKRELALFELIRSDKEGVLKYFFNNN